MKIAICTPVHRDTKAQFTFSLSRMLLRTARTRFLKDRGKTEVKVELEIFFRSSSMLPSVRTNLVRAAQQWGADWILWLDSDHTFPDDTLLALLAHERPVVACNYMNRDGSKPIAVYPPAANGIRYQVETNKEKAKLPLEEVGSSGLGVCLVSMEAIRAASPPLFAYATEEDGSPKTGEDSWFFRRLRDAGFPCFVDHSLSMRVGHIGDIVQTFPA